MKYFLDTNVIADSIRGKSPAIAGHFCKIHSSDIYVSAIVVAELEFGAAHSLDYHKNKALYEEFIRDFKIVPFERAYSEIYGKIRQHLTSAGSVNFCRELKPSFLNADFKNSIS